jgi:vacuolar-type H+-ATPase subunit I/STV1
MRFIENLKKAAENTIQVVSKKTGEIVEDSKTKYSIFDLKNEIEKIYTELGTAIYAARKEDNNISEYIEEKCEQIDKLNFEIEELRKKLD